MPKRAMLKALAIKELRESAGLFALGLLGMIGLIGPWMGVKVVPWLGASQGWYPFANEVHLWDQGFVFGLFAFVLGLKQTAWENHQETLYFLLHRPLKREAVFATKLLVGVAGVLVLNALMIVLYGIWASRPSSHASPFFWSMTLFSWQLAFALLLVYLGAFLSGVRPGAWFGTKLLPSAFSTGVIVFVMYSQWWWWYTLTIGMASAAAMLVAIFYYVRTSDQ